MANVEFVKMSRENKFRAIQIRDFVPNNETVL